MSSDEFCSYFYYNLKKRIPHTCAGELKVNIRGEHSLCYGIIHNYIDMSPTIGATVNERKLLRIRNARALIIIDQTFILLVNFSLALLTIHPFGRCASLKFTYTNRLEYFVRQIKSK